jgi:O-acetyl-ADP-ribose deacetylase (regulator of RNase III)
MITETLIRTTSLRLLEGDITEQHVDAIVNAANSSLLGGGGVDGAIHRRGGPAILAACKRIRAERYPEGMPTGEAVVTTAGELPAHAVIHTVGPVWRGGNAHEAEQLANAYLNSLTRAVEAGLHSVAFPSISTGAYGYPKRQAAVAALGAMTAFLRGNSVLREVRFVLFSADDLRVYANALEAILSR